MQFMLMTYVDEAGFTKLTPAEQEAGIAAYRAYTEAIMAAGVASSWGRLQPSEAATTVRAADGKPQVLDGPYADSKEQLGGYYIIDVPDLDAALSWAARCPTTSHGVVEVRPFWTEPS
ncbi:YciI family protein [Bauldia litoralis]|uniref:YciI family protein n=1 Tax=Bauldia litoralis TaxID=665467 RepID=UPI003265823A